MRALNFTYRIVIAAIQIKLLIESNVRNTNRIEQTKNNKRGEMCAIPFISFGDRLCKYYTYILETNTFFRENTFIVTTKISGE